MTDTRWEKMVAYIGPPDEDVYWALNEDKPWEVFTEYWLEVHTPRLIHYARSLARNDAIADLIMDPIEFDKFIFNHLIDQIETSMRKEEDDLQNPDHRIP